MHDDLHERNGQARRMRALTPEEEARLLQLSGDNIPVRPDLPDDDTTQRRYLAALLTDPELFAGALPVLQPEHFSNGAHILALKVARQHWSEYGAIPEAWQLDKLLTDELRDSSAELRLHYRAEITSIYQYYCPGLQTRDHILAELRRHAKKQAIKLSYHKTLDFLDDDPDKAVEVLQRQFADLQRRAGQDSGPALLTGDELLSLPPAQWLVHGHFPENSTAVIYGKYASLKSFFALDLALCVASGKDFLGAYPVRRGPAVYVAGEGKAGYRKRLAAWLKHHGQVQSPEGFFALFHRFNMADPAEADKLLGILSQYGVKPALVVFDTLARNLTGSDSDPETMNAFIASMDHLRDSLPGSCILAVHHSGKDETRGARGFSGLPGAVDCILELKRTETGCKVRQEKQKDAEELEPYHLRALAVDLADGESSLVLNLDLATATVAMPVNCSERAQLEQDKAAVLAILPRLADKPSTELAYSRARIGAVLGWGRSKVRCVMDAFELEQPGPIRWTSFGDAKNATRYYWVEQDNVQPDKNEP